VKYLKGKEFMSGKKQNILYVYLTIFLICTAGAFLWQLFFPDIAAGYSSWNTSEGWQREIALWNAGLDIAIIITLIKKNDRYAEILTLTSTILCLLLGVNHFMTAVTSKGNTFLHWVGTIEVFGLGFGLGLAALCRSSFFNILKKRDPGETRHPL
jgi:hypothetical protein